MPDKPVLLIVDDDEDIRSQMKWALVNEYELLLAEDRPGAMAAFRANRPPVVLLDLGLPPNPGDATEGMAALDELLGLESLVKVIVITGQTDRQNALRAVGLGAYDFLSKPVEMEELKVILRRAFHLAQLEREHRDMQRRLRSAAFEDMLGASQPMQEVFAILRKVATSDAPLLVVGESGTGKEIAARTVHHLSGRKNGPFIAIDCGAIPETLLESELFGHERGAFTGAHVQRKGRLEMAAGGTVFLDEIAELSGPLQVKLLRFLQDRTIERIGGREIIEVDARVIAATNRDLTKAIEEGRFREDLFYRLAVVTIRLPPLRERGGDIHLLAQAFLRRFTGAKRNPPRFSEEAVKALGLHPWPGNVRELENKVKRAVIMAEGRHITPEDLELVAPVPDTQPRTLKEAREATERHLIEMALGRHHGKIAAAAAELGVSRPTLYELMEKLGISRDRDSERAGSDLAT
jgi:two-component system NtrC family response regulator